MLYVGPCNRDLHTTYTLMPPCVTRILSGAKRARGPTLAASTLEPDPGGAPDKMMVTHEHHKKNYTTPAAPYVTTKSLGSGGVRSRQTNIMVRSGSRRQVESLNLELCLDRVCCHFITLEPRAS